MVAAASSHRSNATLALVGAAAAAALLARAIKRALSPTHTSKLACRCGKIQGTVAAKREDSIRIHCYCTDCRQYANFIAQLGSGSSGNKVEESSTVVCQPHGESRVVQVCKSAVTIEQGQELLGLARKKAPDSKDKKVYMHRFYAKCCHVPLMNTVDFLGFVGIFTDFLDQTCVPCFDGPVAMFPKEALVDPKSRENDIYVPDFLWKLLRYIPWAKSGPFDYALEPVYWG